MHFRNSINVVINFLPNCLCVYFYVGRPLRQNRDVGKVYVLMQIKNVIIVSKSMLRDIKCND